MMDELKNWAGNYKYNASSLHIPENVEQIQELVSSSNHMKVLGTRHSFNGIADSHKDLISLQKLDRVVSLDLDRQTVTVEAGVKYGELSLYLHRNGYALHNMASLPHISVVGACATGTHGSGDQNGSLATAVRAMEIVMGNGELAELSSEHDHQYIDGVVVGLGGLGVVTKLTLDVVPAFQMRQDVYENLPLEHLKEHFDEIFASAYSVSLFTDWKNAMFNQVWLKLLDTDRGCLELSPDFFGATPATSDRHPLPDHEAENCTEQMGVFGPWHERLPHFRLDFTPSSGDELQSEYIVPREHAYNALHAIHRIREHVVPLLHISEVRTIAQDNLWMSPFYQQDSVSIHFTWKDHWIEVQKVLPMIEEQLEPFNARPHWGKLFTMQPEILQSRYEKLSDFQELLRYYDPQGKFRNPFLNTYIFGGEQP